LQKQAEIHSSLKDCVQFVAACIAHHRSWRPVPMAIIHANRAPFFLNTFRLLDKKT